MATSDEFRRGALHGSLIGATALAALSLAIPLPMSDGKTGVPVADLSDGAMISAPRIQDDLPRIDVAPVSGGTIDETSSARVSELPEDAYNNHEIIIVSEVPDTIDPAAGDVRKSVQMIPPAGSEFSRAEDLSPQLPANSPAPGTPGLSAAPAVSTPGFEEAPSMAVRTVTRPDTLNHAEALPPGPEQQSVPDMPSAGDSLPVFVRLPDRIVVPMQDREPMAASSAAPEGVPDDTTRVLSVRDLVQVDPAGNAVVMGAAADDLPAGMDGLGEDDMDPESGAAQASGAAIDLLPDDEAGSPATTPVRPVLSALTMPDPGLEAVPMSPEATDTIDIVTHESDPDITAGIADVPPLPLPPLRTNLMQGGDLLTRVKSQAAAKADLRGGGEPAADPAPLQVEQAESGLPFGNPAPDLAVPSIPLLGNL